MTSRSGRGASRSGSRRARSTPRTRRTRRIAAGILAAVLLGVYLHVPGTFAAFSATATSSGNAIGAGAAFPDYPTRVNADSPSFYYRLNEAAGSMTALDSSTHAQNGIYSTTNPNRWTGFWPFDEGSGTVATDVSTNVPTHDLAITGATFDPSGRSGTALKFNGTSNFAAAASSAVTTTASFTVSAWVYLTDTTVTRTAVSQSGTNISGFELGYDKALDRWAFTTPRTDNAGATLDQARSTAAPTLNTWTLLTGSLNAGSGIDLWVNGVKQTGAGHTAGNTWAAGGVFEVGVGLSTTATHFWKGFVDNVRIWDGNTNTPYVQELTLGATGGPSTNWQFNEGAGATSTVDYSGNLNTGTLGSGAGWAAGKSGAAAVDLAGAATGYVSGAASGVNTSTSFTVSAWVYLTNTTLGAMSRVALSQSAGIKSGFMLRYNYYNTQWEFAVTRGAADNYAPVYDSSYSAIGSAALDTWTHLIGVYDSVAQTVTLYVNGVAMTPAAHTSVFDATGPLQVGRVKEFGAWQTGATPQEAWGAWAGRVDDVRTFRRALDAGEINVLYNGGNTYTTLGVPGALQGVQQGQQATTAEAFSSAGRALYNPTTYTNPTTYSVECWFRSAGVNGATNGATLVSFGNKGAGNSTSFDRRLLLDTSGHVVAGTSSGTAGTAQSPNTYFDSAWHYAAATVSPGTGIKLYVDGLLVASAAYSAPGNFVGYWRWGGDTWSATWPADYLWYAVLDEVAVYPAVLSAQQVSWHYHANH